MPGILHSMMQMDLENFTPVQVKPKSERSRRCECLLTSEKVRHQLNKFPSSKPIKPNDLLVPSIGYPYEKMCRECIATDFKIGHHPIPEASANKQDLETEIPHVISINNLDKKLANTIKKGRAWGIANELVQLLQLMMIATALMLYYVIYGWMNLVYNALRVALYFFEADRPMKITLGVVAMTSLVVGSNVLLRIRKLYTDILR